jgi:Zn-dependent protease
MRNYLREMWYRLRQNPTMLMFLLIMLLNGPLRALMYGGIGSFFDWFVDTILMLPAIIIGLSFHEYAHAKVAVLCGDNTPLYQGRVTLDPRAHIDPIGLACLLLIHFGWGQPVRIDPRNFRSRRRDMILVGLAGITMNFLLAVAVGLILGVITRLLPGFLYSNVLGNALGRVLMQIAVVNVSLMLFNLLPVPPLDGFGVVCDVFNLRGSGFYNFVYFNSRWILMAMIFFGIPSMLLSRPLSIIISGIMNIFGVQGWYLLL